MECYVRFKAALLATFLSLLTGCGTINTVFRDDVVAGINLKNSGTYCSTIPRIYSGTVYDFCLLNGEPKMQNDEPDTPISPTKRRQAQVVPGALLDLPVSTVLDTLVLPYTIYRQNTDGSLVIAK
jgi:uncharacterized protein YceK